MQESALSSSDDDDQEAVTFQVVPMLESVDCHQPYHTEAPVVPELSLLLPGSHGNVAGPPQIVPHGEAVGGVDLAEASLHTILTAVTNLEMRMEQMSSQFLFELSQIHHRVEDVTARVGILEQKITSHSPADREVPEMVVRNSPDQWLPFQQPASDGEASGTSPSNSLRWQIPDSTDDSPFVPPPGSGNHTRPCFPPLPPLPPSPT